ncbi:MAG: hypothetical protein Q9222_004011 [Ikaeria aurantiellina]
MDEPDAEYAPQSPDLSGYYGSGYETQQQQSFHPSQQYHQDTFNAPSNSYNNQYSYSAPLNPSFQTQQYPGIMPQNGHPIKSEKFYGQDDDADWTPHDVTAKGNRKGKNIQQQIDDDCGKAAPGVEEGIKVATKFPVARIKRIMQADEDVGKVAQVTPTAVSLELFMISVVTKAANVAKDKSSKRVTAAHLKQAMTNDEQLDFLADIIAKVPDAPAPKKDEDSEEAVEGKRKKSGGAGAGGGRRRKKADDGF